MHVNFRSTALQMSSVTIGFELYVPVYTILIAFFE